MGKYIYYQGQVSESADTLLQPGKRGPGQTNGLFETMRISRNAILFEEQHFNRLFNGLAALKHDPPPSFTRVQIKAAILQLCEQNRHQGSGRVRLSVFPINGTLEILVESWELDNKYIFNPAGLRVSIYPGEQKQVNELSAFKLTGAGLYAQAAIYAREQNLDDCLVLNTAGNICDSSISNVFWTNNQTIYTPPLSEGCLAGVMRFYLLKNLSRAGFSIQEQPLNRATLQTADEVFLTNVIRGIRPVVEFEQVKYRVNISHKIFTTLVAPLT